MSDVMAVLALPRTLKLYDCRNFNFLTKVLYYRFNSNINNVHLHERTSQTLHALFPKTDFIMNVPADLKWLTKFIMYESQESKPEVTREYLNAFTT